MRLIILICRCLICYSGHSRTQLISKPTMAFIPDHLTTSLRCYCSKMSAVPHKTSEMKTYLYYIVRYRGTIKHPTSRTWIPAYASMTSILLSDQNLDRPGIKPTNSKRRLSYADILLSRAQPRDLSTVVLIC